MNLCYSTPVDYSPSGIKAAGFQIQAHMGKVIILLTTGGRVRGKEHTEAARTQTSTVLTHNSSRFWKMTFLSSLSLSNLQSIEMVVFDVCFLF